MVSEEASNSPASSSSDLGTAVAKFLDRISEISQEFGNRVHVLQKDVSLKLLRNTNCFDKEQVLHGCSKDMVEIIQGTKKELALLEKDILSQSDEAIKEREERDANAKPNNKKEAPVDANNQKPVVVALTKQKDSNHSNQTVNEQDSDEGKEEKKSDTDEEQNKHENEARIADKSDSGAEKEGKQAAEENSTAENAGKDSKLIELEKVKQEVLQSDDDDKDSLAQEETDIQSGDEPDDSMMIEKAIFKKKIPSKFDEIEASNTISLNTSIEKEVQNSSSEHADSKLLSKCVVTLKRLDHGGKSKKRKRPRNDSDAEIDRLCSLKSLEKGASKGKLKSHGESNVSERQKKKRDRQAKNEKPRLGDMSSSDDDFTNEEDSDDEFEHSKAKEKSLKEMQNSLASKAVLDSSSENDSNVSSDESHVSEGKKKKKISKEKNPSKSSKRTHDSASFMNVKLDETESKQKEKLKESSSGDEANLSSIKSQGKKMREKRKKKKIITSDSDESDTKAADDTDDYVQEEIDDEDEEENGNEENSDSDSDEPKPKKRRKRIKKNSSSEESENEEDSPTKGRKHIRKIISDKKVAKETKEAATVERERRKRMEERQKLYNQSFQVEEGGSLESLPLDFDTESKEILVEVDKEIVKNLKPHQANGIKFMWDAVFESKNDLIEGKCPGGAILAHCMGLGKTLQTIGLVHTVLTNFDEQIKRVMVLCPVNTVKNWAEEFEKWLPGDLALDVHEMSTEKDNWGRADRLNFWFREGGVLILGYDMFRNLSNEHKKFKKKQQETFQKTLVDPGPDIVVCDEGHVLKNMKSALNKAMNRIKTKRRIILTGTPLQNNLAEYYAMVNFVKPQLLGTINEFKNRFVNPIQNGQHSDSTERDVRIMKKRSFILNDLLKGCMQRLDYNVLVPYLQPKHEYVISICLTEFQKKLYRFYLENFARAGQIGSDGKLEGGKKGGLFYDVQNLSRVWNHPYILKMAKTRADMKEMLDDDEDEAGSIKDFIDDRSATDISSSESGSNSDSDVECVDESNQSSKRGTRSQIKDKSELVGGIEEVKQESLAAERGWWHQFMDDEDELDKLELGSKMVILMDILKECELLGDKVLVFSQSLLSLDLIEAFLEKKNSEKKSDPEPESEDLMYIGTWLKGRDYFRMDGSTPPETRKKWCNYFNKESNHRSRLFLISTRAGGLGINLCAANRVIIFDASWNPAHDVQSIFRVYRFGQKKPVYIYRFLAKGTMEEKIYDRQVTKQSLSARVVDEHQIERHFSMNELSELYEFRDDSMDQRPVPNVPKDLLMAEILKKHANLIWKFHDHDSLLENQVEENLTEEERKAAWEEFENEKKGLINFGNVALQNTFMANINPQIIQDQYRKQYPFLTEEQVIHATRAYIMQLQSGFHRKPAYDKSHYQQEMARAKMQERMMYPHLYSNSRRSGDESSNSSLDLLQWQAKVLEQQRQYEERQRLAQNLAQLGQRMPSFTSATHPETIDLVNDNANTSGEIVLDGEPSYEVLPSTSSGSRSGRRGRPRLDPDTDIY